MSSDTEKGIFLTDWRVFNADSSKSGHSRTRVRTNIATMEEKEHTNTTSKVPSLAPRHLPRHLITHTPERRVIQMPDQRVTSTKPLPTKPADAHLAHELHRRAVNPELGRASDHDAAADIGGPVFGHIFRVLEVASVVPLEVVLALAA